MEGGKRQKEREKERERKRNRCGELGALQQEFISERRAGRCSDAATELVAKRRVDSSQKERERDKERKSETDEEKGGREEGRKGGG